MLSMITQVHTPETCPIVEPGTADILINIKAAGVKVKGRWGAFPRHTIWYFVEADSIDAIGEFHRPGMKRCVTTVEPVFETPLPR